MSSTVVRSLIVNVAVEAPGAAPADAACLSETLDQLAARGETVALPEQVTTAMTELKVATGRMERLVERVSGDAATLGELAAEVSPPAAELA
jgi:hypothetical protein